jgi:hypothetical protein
MSLAGLPATNARGDEMSDRSWFFGHQGQQHGPYPEAQFRDFVAQGTITAQTLVWSQGMTGWQRAGDGSSRMCASRKRPDITFTGRPGDIWYAFVILALGIYAGLSRVPYLPYVLIPVQAGIWWIIVRWLVENVSLDGHQHPLTFTGGAWAYVGWYLLGFPPGLTCVRAASLPAPPTPPACRPA